MAPLLLALAPVLAELAKNGLNLIGSAILSKGKDVVEQELGVKIDEQTLKDPALVAQMQTAQMEHEEKLLEMALEDRKIDLDYYKQDIADVASARARDATLVASGIVNTRANILATAAILLVVGCLAVVVWQADTNDFVKATITLILGRSLGWVEQLFSFEFGSTRANRTKDDTISNLSSKDK